MHTVNTGGGVEEQGSPAPPFCNGDRKGKYNRRENRREYEIYRWLLASK